MKPVKVSDIYTQSSNEPRPNWEPLMNAILLVSATGSGITDNERSQGVFGPQNKKAKKSRNIVNLKSFMPSLPYYDHSRHDNKDWPNYLEDIYVNGGLKKLLPGMRSSKNTKEYRWVVTAHLLGIVKEAFNVLGGLNPMPEQSVFSSQDGHKCAFNPYSHYLKYFSTIFSSGNIKQRLMRKIKKRLKRELGDTDDWKDTNLSYVRAIASIELVLDSVFDGKNQEVLLNQEPEDALKMIQKFIKRHGDWGILCTMQKEDPDTLDDSTH